MTSRFLLSALAASLLIAASAPLQARLGETEAQSEARYGAPNPELIGANEQPLLPGAKELAYNYQGWRVRSAFVNGNAVRVEYAKIPDVGGLKKLTDDEVHSILEAEKGSFTWREEKPRTGNAGLNALKTAFEGKNWERSDHALASFKAGLILVIETREAEAAARKAAKQAGKATPAPNPNVPKF